MIFRDKNLEIDTAHIKLGRTIGDHHIYIIPKDSINAGRNRKQIIILEGAGVNRIAIDSVWQAVKVPDELILKAGKTKFIRVLPGSVQPAAIINQKDVLIPVGATPQVIILSDKGKNKLKPVKKVKNAVSAPNTGTADLKLRNLKYFPNPNNGRFNLSFHSARTGNLVIEIFNAVGQKIYNETYQNFSGRFNREIDISDMGKGVFLLKIGQNNSFLTKRMVVE